MKSQKLEHNTDQVSEKANVFQTQNFKAKGLIGNKVGLHALGMCCARCNRHGHVASFCRTQEKNITRHQQYVELIEPVLLALHPDQLSRPLPYVSEVHERYVPYCANAILCTTQGIRRPVIFLRDFRSLQSLVSRESLRPGDFVNNGENRLIQGIFGSPSKMIKFQEGFFVAWLIFSQGV